MSTEQQPDPAAEKDVIRPEDSVEDVAGNDQPLRGKSSGDSSGDNDDAGAVTDVDALRNEVKELTDQVLRARAETENIRRRAARDVENAHKFALEKFAGQLLPVADSLEKAVEAAGQAAGASDDEAVAAIAEGVSLSLKLFLDTLAKGGIEAIDPLGHPFDPQLHEAMAMVPSPDAEPNTVIDVMQKGYVLNGRLVRAAMVAVAKAADA